VRQMIRCGAKPMRTNATMIVNPGWREAFPHSSRHGTEQDDQGAAIGRIGVFVWATDVPMVTVNTAVSFGNSFVVGRSVRTVETGLGFIGKCSGKMFQALFSWKK